jgi:hypothetical protein
MIRQLTADDKAAHDEFGTSVAIDTGYAADYLIVGAPEDSHGGFTEAGSAYIFKRVLGSPDDDYVQVKKLVASDPMDHDGFGFSVAIYGDYAVVGAPSKTEAESGSDGAGAVYVFYRHEGGTDNWGQLCSIWSAIPEVQAQFGYSVAIEGDRAVVGCLRGAVHLIALGSDGCSVQETFGPANVNEPDDRFGYSVDIAYPYVLIGAPDANTNGTDAGLAYVYIITSAPPENDECDGKGVLPIGEVQDMYFTTAYATANTGGTCVNGENIWFCYTPSATCTATVSLCGSTFDTKLAVYEGCSCAPLGTQLCCDDNSCGLQSECRVPVVADNQYLIEVGGDLGDAGVGFLSTVLSFTCGDANANGSVDIDDVIYLVAYIFSGGPEPVPYEAGDVNCSGVVDIDDIVYLIAYIFSGGPEPCANCDKGSEFGKRTAGSAALSCTVSKTGESTITSVSIDAEREAQAVQLDYEIQGDVHDILVECPVDGIQEFHGIVDGKLRVGLLDLRGEVMIPPQALEIVRILYSGDGVIDLDDGIVVAKGGGRLNTVVSWQPADATVPKSFAIAQNYPNPFNPTTEISFSLPCASHTRLDIYNIKGRKVRTLIDEYRPAGNHVVMWEGSDSNGKPVATGVYFYHIEAGDFTASKKMLLLK